MVKSNSIGADGISVEVLHTLADVITPISCNIFNRSLEAGVYPALWKKINSYAA